MYRGASLTASDKDAMLHLMWVSTGRVLPVKDWGQRPVPQGTSVFMKHADGGFEYMFTKDEKYDGEVDWREGEQEVRETLATYTPEDYFGMVFYMNRDALRIASRHSKMAY